MIFGVRLGADIGANCVTDPTFLPGHAAAIKVNLGGKNHTIGVFGI
jgi:hypothetical protein